MVEKTFSLTIDDFMQIYEREGAFEIINGTRIPMSPTKFGHVHLATKLLLAITNHAQKQNLGEAYNEVPFVLTDDRNWVKGSRVPDVAFVLQARLDDYKANTPDWKDRPLMLVPDLVVEIISPTDRYTEVNEKVDRYLDDGVNLIWVIDPARKTVAVHDTQNKRQYTLTEKDTLSGSDIIPEFTLKLAHFFD